MNTHVLCLFASLCLFSVVCHFFFFLFLSLSSGLPGTSHHLGRRCCTFWFLVLGVVFLCCRSLSILFLSLAVRRLTKDLVSPRAALLHLLISCYRISLLFVAVLFIFFLFRSLSFGLPGTSHHLGWRCCTFWFLVLGFVFSDCRIFSFSLSSSFSLCQGAYQDRPRRNLNQSVTHKYIHIYIHICISLRLTTHSFACSRLFLLLG